MVSLGCLFFSGVFRSSTDRLRQGPSHDIETNYSSWYINQENNGYLYGKAALEAGVTREVKL